MSVSDRYTCTCLIRLEKFKSYMKVYIKKQRRSQFMWTFMIKNTRVFNIKISLRYVGYL